jgi:hypothetical protein
MMNLKLKFNGRTTPAAILLAAWVACSCMTAHAQDVAVPKYLSIARDFVANTKPDNNSYRNDHGYTKKPGDFLASDWVVSTDCSGFVADMLRRGDTGVIENMETKKFRNRDSLIDMHKAIKDGSTFKTLTKVTDLQPGDVVAWLYRGGAHNLPGHILFVDTAPVKADGGKLQQDGLTMYEMYIIDTSQEAKSKDDTRYVKDQELRDDNEAKGKQGGTTASKNYKGVGRGKIRLYADANGTLQGVAFGYANSKFHSVPSEWEAVMGHPKVKS